MPKVAVFGQNSCTKRTKRVVFTKKALFLLLFIYTKVYLWNLTNYFNGNNGEVAMANEKKKKRTIALIACSGSKSLEEGSKKKIQAQKLYTGQTFELARDKGVKKFHCDDFYIISAKHHLLEKNKPTGWYNVQLKSSVIDHERKGKTKETNSQWAKKVLEQLKQKGFDLKKDLFIIFGGQNYYKNLIRHLNCRFFRFRPGQYSLTEEDLNLKYWEKSTNEGK